MCPIAPHSLFPDIKNACFPSCCAHVTCHIQIKLGWEKKAHNPNHTILTYAFQCLIVLPLTENLSAIRIPFTISNTSTISVTRFPVVSQCLQHVTLRDTQVCLIPRLVNTNQSCFWWWILGVGAGRLDDVCVCVRLGLDLRLYSQGRSLDGWVRQHCFRGGQAGVCLMYLWMSNHVWMGYVHEMNL